MISKEVKYQKQENSDVNEIDEHIEKLPKEVYIIAQEIKIVKALAGNDPKQRAKQLKKLRKWLTIRSNSSFAFKEDDLMRIWKGLYYCMWMSDKPLVQEELTEDLGKLTECFADIKTAIQFFGAFLKTMNDEWYGIDQWRMDKFLMLVRRMVRYIFRAMKKFKWSEEAIDDFNLYIHDTILEKSAIGLSMHFMDVFLEELAKVSNGDIEPALTSRFLKPFIKYMAHQKELKLLAHMRTRVFYHLLHQSEMGREYHEKYNAWKQMGFPTASIHDLEKEELSDEESEIEIKPTENNLLDPRAGNVDVHMPILSVDPKYIIEDIEGILYKEETNTKSRKFMKTILDNYKKYQNGVFPLGIQRMPKIKAEPMKPLVQKKIAELDTLEDELMSTTRKIKKLNKRKRKQLLSEINYNDANEENFEKLIEQSLPMSPSLPKKRKPMLDEWISDVVDSEKIKKDEKNLKDETIKHIKKNSIVNGNEKSDAILNKSNILNEVKVLSKKAKLSNSFVSQRIKNEKKSLKKNINKTASMGSKSEWDETTEEVNNSVPKKKIKVKESTVNQGSDFILNSFAKKKLKVEINSLKTSKTPKTPKNKLIGKGQKSKLQNIISTPTSSSKRVKIVLQKNTAQKQCEYIKQVRSSPQLPYDANKKPSKGLLKPNLMPSPINPFYKKKIGLNFDTTI